MDQSPQSQQAQQAMQTKLLAIVAFVLVGFALRQTYAVTMPLAAAFVVIAAVWPVKPWLQRYLPESLQQHRHDTRAVHGAGGFRRRDYLFRGANRASVRRKF